jgi:hypothetical protein
MMSETISQDRRRKVEEVAISKTPTVVPIAATALLSEVPEVAVADFSAAAATMQMAEVEVPEVVVAVAAEAVAAAAEVVGTVEADVVEEEAAIDRWTIMWARATAVAGCSTNALHVVVADAHVVEWRWVEVFRNGRPAWHGLKF